MSNRIHKLLLFTTLLFPWAQLSFGQSGPGVVISSDIYEGRADIVAALCVKLEPGFHATRGCDVRIFIDEDSVPPSNEYHPLVGDITAINATPSSNRNYIMTTTMREATADESLIGQSARMVEIEYLNNAGNPEMSIMVKGSPQKKDLVGNIVKYDVEDRIERLYLPYESVEVNGEWKDATSETFHYHRDSLLEGRDGDARPWQQPLYDGSPLNRPAGEKGMGTHWQGHCSQIKYKCNSSVVSHWKYNPSDIPVGISYPVGSLFYEERIDEDSLRHRVFSDNAGRVVLEETVGRDVGVLRTAFVYNSMGQLRCVVPPLATSPNDEGLCYYYKYDEKGRVCEKRIPGRGTERYVYDKRNRLVLKQDDNQRENCEWSFTQYDPFDRVVLDGCLTTGMGLTGLQNLFDSQNVVDEQWSSNGPLYGYSGASYPSVLQLGVSNIETASWYDGYGYLSLFNQNYNCPDDPSGDPVLYDSRTKGLLTGNMTKVDLNGITVNMLRVNYYDSKGQLLCSVGDNHLGGRTTRFFKYNFSGQITEEATVHYVAEQDSTVISCRYTYDHAGRKLQEYYKLNDHPEFLSRAYEYNAIGDLLNTYLYSLDGGDTFTQKLRYHYNIRGWLTDLNDFENPGYDFFSLRLSYENLDSVLSDEVHYNGNISQMCSNGRYSVPFGFGFYYDEFHRLYSTSYAEGVGLSQGVDAFQENYDYDVNGNLTGLLRKHNGEDIDALMVAYYGGTNQIRQIFDETGQQLGYPCVSGTYLYDYNGNMTYDPSKFLDITYNRFNLPLTVTSAVSERIRYTYSTSGVKLRKEYSTLATPGSRVTDYCDEFLYEDNELVCIFTPFGRITPMETAIDTQWRTSYSLTDHLGNVRAEFVAHSGGQAELLQQTDYYPFGYTMRRNDYASTRPNHHLYGGKELQDETVAGRSLEWYDFEARMYDPVIGRFLSTDPLANDAPAWTPYNAMWDNPIKFVDPTGMWSMDHIEVKLNDDNTYSVVGGEVNADKNIYLVDDEGNYQAVIGEMFTEYSFHDDNGEPVIGARIDPNDLSGMAFFNNEIKDIGLMEYMGNAKGGEPLDFKVRDMTEQTTDEEQLQYKHRGMPFNGQIASARDIGNYAAGYVAGVHGISWESARLAFDALETMQKVGFWQTVRHYPNNRIIEGQPTQQAQYKGYTQGQYTYISRKRK